MGLADQLTLARVAAVPLVVALYVSDFRGHDWWATGLFIAAMTTGWMVAAIVAREFLVSGLRLAALERGVVMHARDLGKLKTWSQATAAIGGFAAAGAWNEHIAWWALLISLVLTWLSGLDYARIAPGLLRGRAVAP
jgi:phosphatidylglycerophosphate synthase